MPQWWVHPNHGLYDQAPAADGAHGITLPKRIARRSRDPLFTPGDRPHDNEIEILQLVGPTALPGAEAASTFSRREGRAAATVAVASANASPKAKRCATMAFFFPIGATLIIIAVVLRYMLLGGSPARCSQATPPTCTPNPNPDPYPYLTLT